ncbi:hypothetical protein HYV82_01150 [Candidatus Woesearchaeota archaeon]|nr:hypothetical protein [Candidatus Woesearchaeota archaeon]
MSLDVIAGILTRYGAVATANHDLPPFCAVYQLSEEGSIWAIQTALSGAGYRFSSWEPAGFYREMLVDRHISQVPQLVIPVIRPMQTPGETEKVHVLKQRAAFLNWLVTPNVYGLITPVTPIIIL